MTVQSRRFRQYAQVLFALTLLVWPFVVSSQPAARPGGASVGYEPLIARGYAALAADDLTTASSIAAKAMTQAPSRYEGFLLAGMVSYRADELDEAETQLRQAMAVATASRLATDEDRGKIAQAQKILTAHKGYVTAMASARQAERAGLYSKAADGYRLAYQSDPSEAETGLKAARLYIEHTDMPAMATAILNQLLANPKDFATADEARKLLEPLPAKILAVARQRSEEAARRGAQLEEQIKSLLARSKELLAQKKYAVAQVTAEQCLAVSADNTDCLMAGAEAATEAGKADKAEKYYRRVIELQPANAYAYNGLAVLLARQETRSNEAVELIEKATKIAPTNSTILNTKASIHFRRGEYSAAVEVMQKAVNFHQSPKNYAGLGEALWLAERRNEARTTWDDALARFPESAELRSTIENYIHETWRQTAKASTFIQNGRASLGLSANGDPALLTTVDGQNGNANFLRFDGTQWKRVASVSLPNRGIGAYDYAPNGNPWIVYFDKEDRRLAVKMFNGSNWVSVGEEGFTSKLANYSSLAFARDGTAYVAFGEKSNRYRATVMKFTGKKWDRVGSDGFSIGQTDTYYDVAVAPNGMPYIVYGNTDLNNSATAMRFDGTHWVAVGQPGFSSGAIKEPIMAFAPDGTPYVAYLDQANGYKPTVVKFNGRQWITLGKAGITANSIFDFVFAISPQGTPTLSCIDSDNRRIATFQFNGADWEKLGLGWINNPKRIWGISLYFSSQGTPVLLYGNAEDDAPITVQKFESNP